MKNFLAVNIPQTDTDDSFQIGSGTSNNASSNEKLSPWNVSRTCAHSDVTSRHTGMRGRISPAQMINKLNINLFIRLSRSNSGAYIIYIAVPITSRNNKHNRKGLKKTF
jgi:hypothetical protein